MAMASLDRVDAQIIKALLEDGRTSYAAIAKETGLTDVAIKKRVESLKRRGVLAGINAELNLEVLGFEKPVYVQIRSELSKTRDLLKRLQGEEHVMELYQVLGEYNLLAKLVLPDLQAAEKFIERLGAMDGVLDIKALMVLSRLKHAKGLPTSSLQKTL